MIFAEQVKNQLLSLIGEMAAVPWLFSKNPETDFSRTRKLDFASTIHFILSMAGSSIKRSFWITLSFLWILPQPRLLASRGAKSFRRHGHFCSTNLIPVFPLEKNIKDTNCWHVMARI